MIKVLFVCHGNICRSPMAEMIFMDKVKAVGLSDELYASSRGVSSEEEGNGIYPPARAELAYHHIPILSHTAHRITDRDFEEFDLIIALDSSNNSALKRRFGSSDKIQMLLSRDVSDPWYTDDFRTAYNDIAEGVDNLLKRLIDK